MEELNVLELFSGVGGYHSALQIIEGRLRKFKLKVIGAVDINTVSNEVTLVLLLTKVSLTPPGVQAQSPGHALSPEKHHGADSGLSEVPGPGPGLHVPALSAPH